MPDDEKRRLRAIELAAIATKLEAQDVRFIAEQPLGLMGAAIQELGRMDHPALQDRLRVLFERWHKEVDTYARLIDRSRALAGDAERIESAHRAVKRALAAHARLSVADAEEVPHAG